MRWTVWRKHEEGIFLSCKFLVSFDEFTKSVEKGKSAMTSEDVC